MSSPVRSYTDPDGVGWLVLSNGARVRLPAGLTQDEGDGRFVLRTGDVMSGALTVRSPLLVDATGDGAAATLSIRGDAGTRRQIAAYTGGQLRWVMRLANDTAESGGNGGSDFALVAYADDGTTIVATPLNIIRATGLATVKGDPTSNLGIATKQYVDAQGVWSDYTPTVRQNGTIVAGTVNLGRFTRIGKTISVEAKWTATAVGASGRVQLSLPTAVTTFWGAPLGQAYIKSASVTTPLFPIHDYDVGGPRLYLGTGAVYSTALAVGDALYLSATYEGV